MTILMMPCQGVLNGIRTSSAEAHEPVERRISRQVKVRFANDRRSGVGLSLARGALSRSTPPRRCPAGQASDALRGPGFGRALMACCGLRAGGLIREDALDRLVHAPHHRSAGGCYGDVRRALGPHTVVTRGWTQAELVAIEGDDGNRRPAAHAIGNAAPEPAPEASSALRPHDDEVGMLLPGDADDLVRGLSDRHYGVKAVRLWW